MKKKESSLPREIISDKCLGNKGLQTVFLEVLGFHILGGGGRVELLLVVHHAATTDTRFLILFEVPCLCLLEKISTGLRPAK